MTAPPSAKFPRHEPGPSCASCDARVAEAHPVLRQWWVKIKTAFPDCHVSWAFRTKELQDLFLRMHKTDLPWPRSKHNATKDGLPNARALDLFRLVPGTAPNGQPAQIATFKSAYYVSVRDWLLSQAAPIVWGGDLRVRIEGQGIVDGDHYELSKDIA